MGKMLVMKKFCEISMEINNRLYVKLSSHLFHASFKLSLVGQQHADNTQRKPKVLTHDHPMIAFIYSRGQGVRVPI